MHVSCIVLRSLLFFFNDTATTEIYTLSLHDALPIFLEVDLFAVEGERDDDAAPGGHVASQSLEHRLEGGPGAASSDRKSTRLNSSHRTISYAVFCLKKKKKYKSKAESKKMGYVSSTA